MLQAFAQEIEPRSYSNAPIGVNFIGFGVAQARSTTYTMSSEILGYTHIFNVAGQSAKINLVIPYAEFTGSASYGGNILSGQTDGLTDPKVKIAVNLYGAPALSVEEFTGYHQDLIIGASLAASIPWGKYDNNQLINLGANRWYFQPGVGASKAVGAWRLEASGAATIFTNNNSFYGNNTYSQSPIYSTEGHVIYYFPNTAWLSADATYFTGGQSAIIGQWVNNYQENWRFGTTLSIPVNKHNSVKIYGSTGVFARTGNNYDLLGVSWQYRWGGGL
jgi:hypothetical protein